MKFVYVGDVPTTLAAGRPVAPGEPLTLTKREAEENARLVHARLLIEVEAKSDSGEEGATQ